MQKFKKIAIIGSGFSGLSAAAYLAKAGHEVHVYEKHDTAGGRARQFRTECGYVFDMGPSWYWMPDIIENFFSDFNTSTQNFFQLVALDPQFEMVFENSDLSVPDGVDELKKMCERIEPGSADKFDQFMSAAKYKYEVGMQDFVNKPCYSWTEFISPKIGLSALKLNLLSDFRTYVSKYFKNEKLRALMEFPVIFLGASPTKIPALYSLMNYGGYALGTHYPMGGFYQVIKAMQKVAEDQGAKFYFNHEVSDINVADKKAQSITVNHKSLMFDAVIASSDYHHSENLLLKEYRNYTDSYWEDKTFAPSCLIFYLGINEKIENLKHHTLFFEHDLDDHIDEIYEQKKWPNKPLFYACCPSKTDPDVAPINKENLFLLMPIATGIEDESSENKDIYLKDMLKRIERHTGIKNLYDKIEYKRVYSISDFKEDYHAYAGNAYGLANTLMQTAVLKPKINNKKIKNLFYTGQLTVPGPGVPPAIISGKIVAQEVDKLT